MPAPGDPVRTTEPAEPVTAPDRGAGGVHVFDTGRLVSNETFFRGEGFRSLLRPVKPIEFPALAYVIEHPEGLIALDTGLSVDAPRRRGLRGFPPVPSTTADRELGPQMRARGMDPGDVRTVVLTHLDWDHTGGLRHFPGAEVLLHSVEQRFARTPPGRLRYPASTLPDGFAPTVYDLDPEPFGPFPASRAVTRSGDVRLVPLPGHSPGQVGLAYEVDGVTLLFVADHALRADWFVEDIAAGRLVMLGPIGKREARGTSRRLAELVRSRPTVLLPSHDADAPDRLARRSVTEL